MSKLRLTNSLLTIQRGAYSSIMGGAPSHGRLALQNRNYFTFRSMSIFMPLKQSSINNSNKGNSGIPFDSNPLRDFSLNRSNRIDRSELKIGLNINNINNNNNNNNNNQNDGATNSKISNANLEKAMLLENTEIREMALASKYGVKAGRTVNVINGDTSTAFRRLDSILFANQVAMDRRNQRFHMKPGKRAELKKSQHHRKVFMKGFKRLMDIVKDAKRKGY